jgi:hypothetical protein
MLHLMTKFIKILNVKRDVIQKHFIQNKSGEKADTVCMYHVYVHVHHISCCLNLCNALSIEDGDRSENI